MVQRVKSLPTMRETWVWSLGLEDPLEKETASHSSILAWRIPWMKEPGRLQSMGSQRVRHDWVTSLSLFSSHPSQLELPFRNTHSITWANVPSTETRTYKVMYLTVKWVGAKVSSTGSMQVVRRRLVEMHRNRNESMGILPIIRDVKLPMDDSVLPIWNQTRNCALTRNIINNDACTMAHGICMSLKEIIIFLSSYKWCYKIVIK